MSQDFSIFHVDVNKQNSSNPQLERHILKEASYGRQIDKITEALNYIIQNKLNDQEQQNSAINDFINQKNKIHQIKQEYSFSSEYFKKQLNHLKNQHVNHDEIKNIIKKLETNLDELNQFLK